MEFAVDVESQYGYHISALNQLQAILTCRSIRNPSATYYNLPVCIPMSDATFSVVTSIFTVGGLCGSVSANVAMDKWGRKGAIRLSAVATALGAGFMGIAGSVGALLLGRWLVGVGAGLGICVGPVFISEIAPSRIRGSVGVLTQLSIVLGIMLTQAFGLWLATPKQWRFVLLISSALSVLQFMASTFVVESPVFIGRDGGADEQKRVGELLWGIDARLQPSAINEAAADPLLADDESGYASHADAEVGREEEEVEPSRAAAITVPQLIRARELRKPLLVACFAMLSQQLSGMLLIFSMSMSMC